MEEVTKIILEENMVAKREYVTGSILGTFRIRVTDKITGYFEGFSDNSKAIRFYDKIIKQYYN